MPSLLSDREEFQPAERRWCCDACQAMYSIDEITAEPEKALVCGHYVEETSMIGAGALATVATLPTGPLASSAVMTVGGEA